LTFEKLHLTGVKSANNNHPSKKGFGWQKKGKETEIKSKVAG
jgi:hypothetical protein